MIPYSYYFISFLWFIGYEYIKINYNSSVKNTRNLISSLHASGVTLITSLYLRGYKIINIIEPFSIGFFIYDLYHCFFNKYNSNKIESIGLTIHHLLTIKVIEYAKYTKYNHLIYKMLFLGELSNLPSYLMYYLKHSDKKNKWYCKYILIFQTIWYSAIRVPIYGYFAYKNLNAFSENYYYNILWLLYYMGIHWSYKLWCQVLK